MILYSLNLDTWIFVFCHPNKLYFIVLDRISSRFTDGFYRKYLIQKKIFNTLTIFNSSNLGVVYSGYRKLNCCKWKEMLDYLSWWSLDLISVVSGLLSGGWERWRNYKHSSTSFSTIYQIFVIHRAQQPALAVYLRSCVNHYTTTLISWNLISEVVQVQRWWNINVSLTRPIKMSFNKVTIDLITDQKCSYSLLISYLIFWLFNFSEDANSHFANYEYCILHFWVCNNNCKDSLTPRFVSGVW